MAEEIKKKAGLLKTICTGVVCAVVGAGVSFGIVDATKVQDALDRAQVRQVAIAAATYSAKEAAVEAVEIVKSDASAADKLEAVSKASDAAVKVTSSAVDGIIDGVIGELKENGVTKDAVKELITVETPAADPAPDPDGEKNN